MEKPRKNKKTGGVKDKTSKPARKGNDSGRIMEQTEDWLRQKAEIVDGLLQNMEEKLQEPEFKASIGDFIRLLQLRKELEEERPREITVRWVEPSEKEDVVVT